MTEKRFNSENEWLSFEPIGDLTPSQLGGLLSERVNKRLEAGEYSEENVRYIANLSLPISRGNLEVSDEVLEKLRRLCQLWNVRFLESKEISSHRPFIGPIIVRLKKLLLPMIKTLMKDVIHQQRAFNAVAVQLLAEIAHQSASENGSKESTLDLEKK